MPFNVRAFLTLALLTAVSAVAQPAFEGPMPSRAPVANAGQRHQAYIDRIDEVLTWRAGRAKPADAPNREAVLVKLARHEDPADCSRQVIELMKNPDSGPFWMFPAVALAYLGRDQLTPEARAAIRNAWRSGTQMRGDTENHWAMYYTSLYLMAELYPHEPASAWYTGKSSEENMAEARDYLISWMDLTTTIGQGEFNPTHYIGEYAIPMLYLAAWAKDPAMRQRGHMMLDWLFADLAANTLNGVLSGANARTDDTSVIERWNALASYFSWLLFGNTPPPANYGGWGIHFAVAAKYYELPEVIYRIATDRSDPFLQRALKRTRRRWRHSDVLTAPIYKTTYMTKYYAVGSYQGGLADPIQTHVWDVTWDVPDPRGVHNTMFSLNPRSSVQDMQMYFTELPDTLVGGVTKQGKPSYDSPEKFLGSSPYEQVYQDLDTIVALYDIPAGERFPHVNGFFSRDLIHLAEDESGWIFAEGGDTYLAYRPLAPYEWKTTAAGDKRLYSPHRKNGTIVQAGSAYDFKDFEDFKKAIRRLPLKFQLEPVPTVTMMTLRGHDIVVTYGQAPVRDEEKVDYSQWKLFEGPYLNAEKGSKRLTITHGSLQRVLDFNTLTISDPTIQP